LKTHAFPLSQNVIPTRRSAFFHIVKLTGDQNTLVRFQVLTATSMKMTVFWDVVRAIALIMEPASSSETSVIFYQTSRRIIPEDSYIKTP
jgi:hypothetical protein